MKGMVFIQNSKHGGDIYSAKSRGASLIDFSANINPLGIPSAVTEAMIASLKDCIHYPDPFCRELVRAISVHEKIDLSWIFCGNGAAEVVFALAYAKKPRHALVLAPTFSEYEQALQATGCEILYHRLKEEEDFVLSHRIFEQINAELDMIFICNPNNPTGQLTDQALLLRILQKCDECNITLVADECFNDFLDYPESNTLLSHCGPYKNLFILKSFTKMYALAGVRLGYGVCSDPELHERMRGCVQPWGVSCIAQTAGVAALTETRFIEETHQIIREERVFLTNSLEKLGFKVFDSNANYILFKADEKLTLQAKLAQQGFLIRSCANYVGLSSKFFRIAVRSHPDNEGLVSALRQVVEV